MNGHEPQVADDQAKSRAEAKPKQARGRFKKGVSGNPSGRRRGAVSKLTLAALVKAYGSPLEFLLCLMSNEKARMSDRLDAARVALPFVHRRLPEHGLDVPPLQERKLSPADRAELEKTDWPQLILPQ
jgi:Family of unknown function (DUF5681)